MIAETIAAAVEMAIEQSHPTIKIILPKRMRDVQKPLPTTPSKREQH